MDERRDDWRQGVDENLASLNTGQRVNDRLIEDLELKVSAIEALLHGTDTTGLIGRVEDIENIAAELRSVVIMDASGNRGLQHDVRELKEGRTDRRLNLSNITKIIVAMIASGLITHFWADIQGFFYKPESSTDVVTRMIIKASQKPKKHRRYVIHEEPIEDDPE